MPYASSRTNQSALGLSSLFLLSSLHCGAATNTNTQADEGECDGTPQRPVLRRADLDRTSGIVSVSFTQENACFFDRYELMKFDFSCNLLNSGAFDRWRPMPEIPQPIQRNDTWVFTDTTFMRGFRCYTMRSRVQETGAWLVSEAISAAAAP